MTENQNSKKSGDVVNHVGIVAVVGRTNAGKSTLMNLVIGEKVSIVSPVVQTTRSVVRGVLTDDRGQLVLLDTPGLHKSRNLLGAEMNKRARGALNGADVVLLLCDGSCSPQLEDDGWMRRLTKSPVPVVIFLNKTDIADKSKEFRSLWDSIVNEKGEPATAPIWMKGSAKTGEATSALMDRLFNLMPKGPLLFDEDTLTDYPRNLALADAIREQFFLKYRDEIPHAIGVQVESVRDNPKGIAVVKATVFVRRHNQKGIVLGEKGRSLRAVTRASARGLSEIIGRQAEADLWIKVEPNWDENFFLLKQIGYI